MSNLNDENSTQIVEFNVVVYDKNYQKIRTTSVVREVPDFKEVDKTSFMPALNKLEEVFVEASKQVATESAEKLLTDGSNKKLQEFIEKPGNKDCQVVESLMGIETVIGTFKPVEFRAMRGGRKVYCSSDNFFPETGSRENLHTAKYNEILLLTIANTTDRFTAKSIELWRGKDNDKTNPMTIRNQATKHGEMIASCLKKKSDKALASIGFINGIPPSNFENTGPDLKSCAVPFEEVEFVANIEKVENFDASDYEDPSKVIKICVDDICVNAQSSKRPPNERRKDERKRWDTTVCTISSVLGNYTITGDGVGATLELTMGFLAHNNLLLNTPIVFYTDGARNIHSDIERMFSFTSHKIVLDWYHLEKKFAEFFSLACRAKKIRNERLNEAMSLLWYGKVDETISMLQSIPDGDLKNRDPLVKLIDYLKRVREYIPNYDLRKMLNLCNSSNSVETANNLIVARRQKKKGMSWSHDGSIYLGKVSCLCHNGDLETWVTENTIPFRPVVKLEEAA
jgi:hypothetical protein